MKAEDIVQQLVGNREGKEYNAYDIDCIQYLGTEKYPEKLVDIELEKGIVTVYTDLDSNIVEQRFAIKATLEPLEE